MKQATIFFLVLSIPALASAGIESDLEGPITGYDQWTMGYALPGSLSGATTLANPVPEYHWWNGCSPTAAGMLFAYWDTYLGKSNLYDGDSSNWDKVNMNMSAQADYDNEHNIVASWGHRQAGIDKGLTYGSWDRNGNGIVDDQAQWDCLADFMRTEDGGTYRSTMAQGFIDYAMWDDPTTLVNESYQATSVTDWSPTWAEYVAEIDAGRPVHVGISGHSILGFGYYESQGVQYVVNWTTWGGGWDGYWGLMDFSEVYGFTTLEIGDWNGAVPEPTTLAIWSAFGTLGLIANRRRRKQAG